MPDTSQGAGSGSDSTTQVEIKEYVVPRDNERPYSFAGVQLAKASRQAGGGLGMLNVEMLEAAVYKTRGGKFITSLSKTTRSSIVATALSATSVETEDQHDLKSNYRKAAVHDTFEDAVGWFRPGRLTDEIRKQLGLDQPIRVE